MGEAKRRREAIARGEPDPGPSAPTPTTLHASERQVGVGFCLCGHPSAEHVWNPMVERASCMLCDALSEDCDRYRPSVRRNESDP